MSLKFRIREVDSVIVADLIGRITVGEDCKRLRDLVRNHIENGHKRILLNLADVTYIDSTGIGELVSAYTAVSNRGGQLKLLNLTKKVHDLLQITKLYTVFDIRNDEGESIRSFARA